MSSTPAQDPVRQSAWTKSFWRPTEKQFVDSPSVSVWDCSRVPVDERSLETMGLLDFAQCFEGHPSSQRVSG